MLGWGSIVRLGLVQMALGAVVVLATSTMNRVMAVELGLPAIVPGALVAWHYALQVLRPGFGHGSDRGGRRTPWIIGGMAALALGGIGTALAIALMTVAPIAGIALAIAAFTLVGVGVGAAGTALLVLLAHATPERRRPAAASIVWIMMIFGFVLTAGIARLVLDPFSPTRLIAVTAAIGTAAMVVACAGVWRLETAAIAPPQAQAAPLRAALAQVWAEPQSRRFAIFVFLSMLAYGAQELLLEPFAAIVFGFTPGASAGLAGLLHGGVLAGMILVGVAATARGGALRPWTTGGCLASACAAAALAWVGLAGAESMVRPIVFAAGAANGAFSIAAIGQMLAQADRRGTRDIPESAWGSGAPPRRWPSRSAASWAPVPATSRMRRPAPRHSAMRPCSPVLPPCSP